MAIELLREAYAKKKAVFAEQEGKILLRRPRLPDKLPPLDDSDDGIPITPPSMKGLAHLFSPKSSERSLNSALLCRECQGAEKRCHAHDHTDIQKSYNILKVPGQWSDKLTTPQLSEHSRPVSGYHDAETSTESDMVPVRHLGYELRKPPSQTPVTEFADDVYGKNVVSQQTFSYEALPPIQKSDTVYILDPNYSTNRRSIPPSRGMPSLLQRPVQPRGPDPFPQREPVRLEDEMPDFLRITDDERYIDYPEFCLENFLCSFAETNDVPLQTMQKTFYSRHNYKQITKLLADCLHPLNHELHAVDIDAELNVDVQPRVPQHQLLLEMAFMVKEHVQAHMKSAKAVIKPLPKFKQGLKPGPHSEIIIYEGEPSGEELASSGLKVVDERGGIVGSPIPRDISAISAMSLRGKLSSKELMVVKHGGHAPPQQGYFHGPQRTSSPFQASQESESISQSELAVLESLMYGATNLNLKGFFISMMPDISHLYSTLTCLNLSYNCFTKIPTAVMKCRHLEMLSLRNNPLTHLPDDIHKLTSLQEFVVSFCLISHVNDSVCRLPKLKILDLKYNNLTKLENNIGKLRALKELDLEGNQLVALPCHAARLKNLIAINLKNNFMSPILWSENMVNKPQKLRDLAALCVTRNELVDVTDDLPPKVITQLESEKKCDCCGGPRFGPGLKVIRPVPRLFGTNNLPLMFLACQPTCLQRFMVRGSSLEDIYGGGSASTARSKLSHHNN